MNLRVLLFAWFAFLTIISMMFLVLLLVDRAASGPSGDWPLPFIAAACVAYALTSAVATAKKDWD